MNLYKVENYNINISEPFRWISFATDSSYEGGRSGGLSKDSEGYSVVSVDLSVSSSRDGAEGTGINDAGSIVTIFIKCLLLYLKHCINMS